MNFKNLVTVFVAFLSVTQIANAQSGWTLHGSTVGSYENKVVVGDADGQSSVPFLVRTGWGLSQSSTPIIRLEHITDGGSAGYWDIENNMGSLSYKFCGNKVYTLTQHIGGYYDYYYNNAIRFSSSNPVDIQGSVAIGSGSILSNAKFTVHGSSFFNGNVGIGVATPQDKLDIAGNLRLSGDIDGYRTNRSFEIAAHSDYFGGARISFGAFDSESGMTIIAGPTDKTSSIKFCNMAGHWIQQNMVITNIGYVGIGTNNPTSLLTVNGKIECEEIEVKNIAADYVFEENYSLTKLNDLEKYIKQNKHLPGIAPASETENGVNLGEFNEKILEKIEELTLYVIELKKENDELRAKLNENK